MILTACAPSAGAQTRQEFRVSRTAQPPRVDAVLDDPVWQGPHLPADGWASYNPNRGDGMPAHLRTDVHIAYDDHSLYLAFQCFDDQPDRIRTTISRRDSVFSDDWIGVSLDTAGTGQSAYHLFVNPSGIQMDALNTSASGEQFDADLLWDSAGRITTDGYIVEIRIPLQSLRFSASKRDLRAHADARVCGDLECG